MSTRVGIVDLCTSHPGGWVPILRSLGYDITACWDSGDTRPQDYTQVFAKENNIPLAVKAPGDMLGKIDVAIIHSANWDKHVSLVRPFVEAGISVLIDKPMAGNLRDANQILDWIKQGKRITGGSGLRFVKESRDLANEPVDQRGVIHTVFAGCAMDEFNYGIHAYALLSGIMGPGIRAVSYLGQSAQKHIRITWQDGRAGILSIGKLNAWIPFHFTAITDKAVRQVTVNNAGIYRSLLESVMPYLAGAVSQPPVSAEFLLEPEMAALAARVSWMNRGAEIFLTDLRQDDPGYDGKQFADEYRRARLG